MEKIKDVQPAQMYTMVVTWVGMKLKDTGLPAGAIGETSRADRWSSSWKQRCGIPRCQGL